MIAAEISTESLDTANLEPMVDTARQELDAAGIEHKPGVVLADAGYWKNDAIEAIVGEGIQTLIAPDADKRKSHGPDAAAASMTSPAECSQPTGASSSTSRGRAP